MSNYIDAVNGQHSSSEECISTVKPRRVSLPTELTRVFAKTDWQLLAQQKTRLADPLSPDYANTVDGVLNWISAVQDALVDSGLYEETRVFPELD